MSEGLKITFRLLGSTDNESAVSVLIAALDSPLAEIQQTALATILSRHNPEGHTEVLRRLHTFKEQPQELLLQQEGRLTHALRNSVLGTDKQLCKNGCQAAIWFHEYDLITTLSSALESPHNPNVDILGQTMLELTHLLFKELVSPRNLDRHDPELIRQRIVNDLERSVLRFGTHHHRGIIEAFAILAKRGNSVLRKILMDPHHPAFVVLIETLQKSASGGVIQLLLSFLNDPQAPSVVLNVIGKREDGNFVESLLNKAGRNPSSSLNHNLKRIQSIGWIHENLELLDQLDESAQPMAVKMMMNSGTPRADVFRAIEHLLHHGKPKGRHAAAEALGHFSGVDANHLVLQGLDDEDPQVLAAMVAHLRERGIPGALPRLVQMVDSPNAMVRRAARESLSEFTFERYLAGFDLLDTEVRHATGELVKKVDPGTLSGIEAEMTSKIRSRRLRALEIAEVMEVIVPLEEFILKLLEDEDHMVRVAAANALGKSHSTASRRALQTALADRSPIVQDAVRLSLEMQGDFLQQHKTNSVPIENQSS